MSVDNMSPLDRLMAAISIIQKEIMASDSQYVPDKMFMPGGYFEISSLHLAERMLMDLIRDVEHLDKPGDNLADRRRA